MGSAVFRPYIRNDRVVGQGKEVLNMSKLINLKNIDLDKIFHEFAKYEDPKTHLADLRVIFQRNRLPYDLYAKVLFQVLDKSKSEHLDFLQFLVTFWSFLSADENGLASFCFSQFDSERSSSLEIKEICFLVNLIWNFKPHRKVIEALKFLDLNIDGLVTVAEFALLSKHQPLLLQPIRNIQKRFRKKIVFSRFWKELSERRYQDFKYQTLFDIVQIYDPTYVISSLDYLTLRPEIPAQFIEQYKFITRKRKQRRKGDIEIPYELKDSLSNAAISHSEFFSLDDEAKSRAGWVMNKSRSSRRVADVMNADSFLSMT